MIILVVVLKESVNYSVNLTSQQNMNSWRPNVNWEMQTHVYRVLDDVLIFLTLQI